MYIGPSQAHFFVELFKYYAEKQLSLMVIVVVSVFAGSKHIKSGM